MVREKDCPGVGAAVIDYGEGWSPWWLDFRESAESPWTSYVWKGRALLEAIEWIRLELYGLRSDQTGGVRPELRMKLIILVLSEQRDVFFFFYPTPPPTCFWDSPA